MKNRSWIKRILLKLFPGKHIQDNNIVRQEINAVDMKINYYTSLEEVNLKTGEDNFVAIIDNIRSNTDLFNTCYKQLEFPEYFGFNWDALLDCMSDYSWLTQKNIILIHSNLELMSLELLYDYVETLFFCYARLKKHPDGYQIHIYFDTKDKACIDKILNEIMNERKYLL